MTRLTVDGSRQWPEILADARARNLSRAACAREQGCSRNTVRWAEKRYGVRLAPDQPEARDWYALLTAGVAQGMTRRLLADKHGVTTQYIGKLARQFGIVIPYATPTPAGSPRGRRAKVRPQSQGPRKCQACGLGHPTLEDQPFHVPARCRWVCGACGLSAPWASTLFTATEQWQRITFRKAKASTEGETP